MSSAQLAIFLQALVLVESGGNPRAVGAAGERGAYQLTPAVAMSAGGYSTRAAEREVRRIVVALEHMGVDPLPFNVYLAYNAGLGAVRRGQAPDVSYQRAQRLVQLMERIEREGTRP